MCPSVRATFGSRSGPMTISATTAMTTISENPTSNMRAATDLRRFLLLRLAFDRRAGDLLCGLRRRRGLFALRRLHALLEAFHRTAQILADIAQLLGAEDQHDDQQYDQPVPDAQSTHVSLLMRSAWAASC